MLELYLPSIITFTGIYILVVISPGPDFAMVVKNSLVYSRRTGMLTALGVSCGAFFHMSYVLLGLGFIIAESKIIFAIVKHAGVAYLFYLGIKGVMAKKRKVTLGEIDHKADISPTKAFAIGFITNVLNPKSILFYISIFSSLVAPNTPKYIIAIYLAIILATKITWFCFVALTLSGKRTRERFMGVTHIIERITGCALIALSVKLLLL